MKKIISILILFSLCLMGKAQKTSIGENEPICSHPRLLLLKGEEVMLKEHIAKDPMWTQIHEAMMGYATKVLKTPLMKRELIGRRLLSVSREGLKRIFFWSYCYRMSHQTAYATRAIEEMMNVASFTDWNPSHFLDVAEMTMAVSIGYDWLFDVLNEQQRAVIRSAIIEKGLKPSYNKKGTWFIKSNNNWNQVCHAGMTYGALAVWETWQPQATDILNRAIENVVIPMKEYAPDGAYPEGINYWEYGTSFNVMLISALEKLFKEDFGLSKIPGFLRTGTYVLNMCSPALNNFSYSDNSSHTGNNPAMYWFYQKTNDASILYNQTKVLQKKGIGIMPSNRLAPAAIIWGATANTSAQEQPKALMWKARGKNPVCTMRSSWNDEQAMFMGIKLGSPSVNHGHMDVGSFVFESQGQMWAIDLGMENYNNIEQQGISLWNMKQESERWNVFRYKNQNHNTLTFGDERQTVGGRADIVTSNEDENNMYLTTDLSTLYTGQIASAKRAFSLIDKEYAVIEDYIVNQDKATTLTWTLMTPAKPTQISKNITRLEQNGKFLYIKVETSAKIEWEYSDAKPKTNYENKNAGISAVRFHLKMNANKKQHLCVILSNENKSHRYKQHF